MGVCSIIPYLVFEITASISNIPAVTMGTRPTTSCTTARFRITLVPRATLRGVAELHVASGMPQWRMFVTSCYI